MAFTGITATEAEIDTKTGSNVSTDFTDTMKTQTLLQAESYVNCLTRFNWSDWYAGSPNVDFKYLITEATTNIVAIYAIKYDFWSFPTIEESEDAINVLWARTDKVLELLKDQNVQTFMTKV